MNNLRSIVEKVAATDANILITGENGTGKEVLANVVLISSVSKAYVAGCVTAEDGSFVLPYADKDVMLKVSFVGYKSQTLACKPTMHIGLHPDTQQLKAVTIKSTRPNVVYKDGAFTTLVSGTILGELGSAEDMISR